MSFITDSSDQFEEDESSFYKTVSNLFDNGDYFYRIDSIKDKDGKRI